jgi:phosphofructokinase-like protein
VAELVDAPDSKSGGVIPRVGSSPTFGKSLSAGVRHRAVEDCSAMSKVGVLTGGGDCPGLNAVIRAVARRLFEHEHDVVGVRSGWRGLVEGLFEPLGPREISGILPRGGTIIGTSRANPYKVEDGVDKVLRNFREAGLDALVAIGGEDTLGVAARLHEEHDFPVVGVPKTIDNDLSGTDYTFGFDTAVFICTEAIDRLHTTAEAHNRVMVVEVMGRNTGWIAVMSGIAGGADVILIPEQPITVERACGEIQRRHNRGKDFSIVVVSEGYELTYESGERRQIVQETAEDEFGHIRLGGVGHVLALDIEERTGYETRVTVLGHVQRGGSPTPRDRVLATRYGLKAADLVEEGGFGRMAALQGDAIVDVSLAEATKEIKTVPEDWYAVASAFFG